MRTERERETFMYFCERREYCAFQLFDETGENELANNYDFCFLTILSNDLLKKRCTFVLGLMATSFHLNPMANRCKI